MAPRPLSTRQRRAWRAFQGMRAQLAAHLARRLAQDSGLTEADYAVTVEVLEAPGRRIRSRDLGRKLGWERSRLSHQIARMEARGTVQRAPCADDARGFDVLLTDAGLAAVQAAYPAHLSAVRHCFADLLTNAQLDSLAEIAETITDHLAAEHDEDGQQH
ncbi:MAG TPA: MarR family winged helix-turn-helix transcriptional regulator [Mycobacterium sp.]|nr:MarR family winged helix-turn-helix transcriptional regulator [Mycobacterium sp.]